MSDAFQLLNQLEHNLISHSVLQATFGITTLVINHVLLADSLIEGRSFFIGLLVAALRPIKSVIGRGSASREGVSRRALTGAALEWDPGTGIFVTEPTREAPQGGRERGRGWPG